MRSTSVIVPTYNRPRELRVCLRSLLRQTVLPNEILVVDDGELEGIPWQNRIEAAGIRCLHIRKEVPGLTESRNIGVEKSTGDIILFFDDDVRLLPDYIERVLEVYERDPNGQVGGVGGFVVNTKRMTLPRLFRYALDLGFGISGLREGRVLRSGFCTDFGETPFPLTDRATVEFLPGAAFSFRREVFEHYAFRPGFRDVALGEDKDFTVRVGRRYRLVLQPAARIFHYESGRMRPEKREWGRKLATTPPLYRRHRWTAHDSDGTRRGGVARISPHVSVCRGKAQDFSRR